MLETHSRSGSLGIEDYSLSQANLEQVFIGLVRAHDEKQDDKQV